ncbi:acyltransferase [Phlyctema vagabunda]|uniref:Acyltransferase n=1 Tax=Phlyctema vagabunda TaxID=108571 RepID=A0ABR4PHM3_9HELO
MAAKQENVKWVDGLRGVASFFVVVTHLCRAFDDVLFSPTTGEQAGSPVRLFQRPFLRVFVQGRIGVAVFSMVTGYVCALKPVKTMRAGRPELALQNIAKSAFRRIPRLFLPAAIATVLCWFVAQFGVFEVGKRCDSYWVGLTNPEPTPWVGQSIISLMWSLIRTWTIGQNYYDGNQWTMLPLLRGSMIVYVMLFVTAYMKSRHRMMTMFGFFLYYYIGNDSIFGMQFFFGVFLSELSQTPSHKEFLSKHSKILSRAISPCVFTLGLYFASYPNDNPAWAPWSRSLSTFGSYIFPPGSDTPHFFTGVGLIMIAISIHISNFLKDALSSKHLLWLGKNSFAVYLLHGGLLRSVLIWFVYGTYYPPDYKNDKGEVVRPPPLTRPGNLHIWIAITVWYVLLYSLANQWMKHVDPWCARTTQKLEKYVWAEPGGEQSSTDKVDGADKRSDGRILPV